jgi:L-gulonate 5-dehydrogenase
MKVVLLNQFGGPDCLQGNTVATPTPRPGEAVVRVAAVEVSRTRDLGTCSGNHPFSLLVRFPHVLGGHCAGTVAAVGSGVDPTLVGRPVAVMGHHTCGQCDACRSGTDEACDDLELLGIHRWGSYAQYAAVPATSVHPVPEDVDLCEVAAMAATGPVGLTQLRRARLQAGDVVVLPGRTGALAQTITALARQLGVRVIGLSRTGDSRSSDTVTINTNRRDLAEAILQEAGGRPVAVLDNVCDPGTFDRYFPILANGARIVISGAIGHPLPTLRVPARELYSRNVSLIGVRSHSAECADEFWQLVRNGFRLSVGSIHKHPLASATAVHTAVAEGTLSGHNVLMPPPIDEMHAEEPRA